MNADGSSGGESLPVEARDIVSGVCGRGEEEGVKRGEYASGSGGHRRSSAIGSNCCDPRTSLYLRVMEGKRWWCTLEMLARLLVELLMGSEAARAISGVRGGGWDVSCGG